MAESLSPTLKAVSDAVLAVAAELSVEDVLQRLVDSARELAGARYAALGLPDGEGGFRRFLTSGMSEELMASLGPLPRQHGVLGAILESTESYRTHDMHDHPRFRGWWPDGHPDMRTFVGVPIVAPSGVIGGFYLTEKVGAEDFADEDVELIELLAAHAAIAITNARLYEESRELSIVAERNRLALDLHDSVSQKLFGLLLSAQAAELLLERDPPKAREQVSKLPGLAREALDELRSLVFELRPPDLERDGLCGALRKHVEVVRRIRQQEIELEIDDELPAHPVRDAEVLRVAQEALQNVIKHANAQRIRVKLHADGGRLVLEVEDDGGGFEPDTPGIRSRRLGLTSMEERAQRAGGTLEIRSTPGVGTCVRLEIGSV
jgi:signal transduction histidine kinase